MIGFYNYTVIITYVSLVAAILGMRFAAMGDIKYAVLCLLLSGLCDMTDGPVARLRKRTDTEKKFGIQIDSLCDCVSFGVAPAMILYYIAVYNAPESEAAKTIALIVGIIFALCAVIRLAYFNVTEEERQQREGGKKRTSYQGLPVTNISIILSTAYLSDYFLDGEAFVYTMIVIMAITAFLFVLNFRMVKLHGKKLIPVGLLGVLVMVGVILL